MKLLENLNQAQNQAVTAPDGPFLIIAGAGTGKTTVIVRRIAWLILHKKVASDHILALTFTDKAAGEMEERVEALLPYGYHDLWISTFHAFCERILQENALEIGLPNEFKLLTETEQWLILRKNLHRLKLRYYSPLGNPTKFLQAIVKHFSRLKDENITPQQYLSHAENLAMNTETIEIPATQAGKSTEQKEELTDAARIMELANAYHEYQKILLEDQALDFGDLIAYTIQLFEKRPSILKKYQDQFQYILIDEFQDTNHAQYELIKLLSKPRENIAVCLDDDQSIYKFRGASVSNVLEFKKDYPKSREVVLTENYRSPQNILDCAYQFIQHNNPDRLEFQLKNNAENFHISSVISKQLNSQFKTEGTIECLQASTSEEEAKIVLEKIIEIKKKNTNCAWNDFAILIRANDQADQFMPVFERNDVPYQFVASKGLFHKPEIIDVLSYLKMLDNYHETNSFYRVLNFEMWKIDPIDIMRIVEFATKKSISLYESITLAPAIPKLKEETMRSLEKIISLVGKHTQTAREKSAGQTTLEFLEESGYLRHLNAKDERTVIEKINNIQQFYKLIEVFERSGTDRSTRNFLAEMDMKQESGEQGDLSKIIDIGPDSIKIMTIHSAKGLEFSYVFIVNMVDKRFPSVHKQDRIPIPKELVKETLPSGDAHIQEERRLFYVACTRAKRGLYFTSAFDYGGTRKKKPSRFLYEAKLLKPEAAEKPKVKKTKEVFDFSRIHVPIRAQNKFEYALPNKFSFTQLSAFEACPYQYRFAHILKIPVKGRPTFSFGKTIHNTLYQALKRAQEGSTEQKTLFRTESPEHGSNMPLEELMAIYQAQWIDNWYESKKQKNEYKETGKRILKQFWEKYDHGNFPKALFLEKTFNVKIGSYVVKGVIDRLDPGVNPKTVKILDYKTGSVPKKEKDIKWRQLSLYALACKEVFGFEPEEMTYYYLDQNKEITKKVTSKDIESSQIEIKQILDALNASDFRATPGFHCTFCDFQDICDFRK